MFDERWPQEADELDRALAALLSKYCSPEALRLIEVDAADALQSAGRLDELDRALRDFGLWDLPPDPYLLTRAAVTLGAHLAPSPFVSAMPAFVLLGERDVANGVDRPVVPAGLPRVAVAVGSRLEIGEMPATVSRSAAGERIVRVECGTTQSGGGEPDAMRAWGFLLEAARLVGAAQALIQYGVDYVAERRQFGVPVGSFQGVANPLADAATAVQAADLLVRHGAYIAASDGALPLFAAVLAAAKARSGSRQAAATVHQALGGYGFSLEADCQLYSRRIRAWSAAMPDPSPWLAELARTLVDPATREQVTDLWQFERGFALPRWSRETD
ncbi:acyl-CoA dehydrogenase family protein [[Mycobacterium] vasticus]|uniref:Acyl-CoA dehydrogenase family protein n=1 Tax=[Mycobacterium] vasticus TaxID=2875777 RepID=A0ABU5Z236_9MYCO|nr:acyl-CoA dehydrogenase family protein [Mycolicibacter sp. MYC017]MEB3071468.1 acyl-CoA dehydrogenase family protein [Mycolicibacter sp. MYC017]